MLYLVGARARYTQELVGIAADLGSGPFVEIDNLHTQVGSPPHSRSIDSMRILDGVYVLCPSVPGIRYRMAQELKPHGFRAADSLIHPTSSLDRSCEFLEGLTINRLVAIGSNSKIGAHVQINRSVSIGHDCSIGDFATFGPGVTIAGGVTVGRGSFLGAACVVLPGITIGENAVVGAGAVVTKDVAPFAVVVGNPGRETVISDSGYKGYTVP